MCERVINNLIKDISNILIEFTEKCHQNPNTDINLEFDSLSEILQLSINKNIPLKKLSRRKTKILRKPWITPEIIISIKTRNKLFQKLVKTNFSNKELHNKYKEIRNNVKRDILRAKKLHYQKCFERSSNNCKDTWKTINRIMGKNNKSLSLPDKLEKNDQILVNKTEIADTLNHHFANIGKNNTNNEIDFSYINKNLNHWQQNSFAFFETTSSEIIQVISSLKNKKTEGTDELPVSILISLKHVLSPILCYLFNKSIKIGVFPDCLKIAKVLPLFKGGIASDPSNYRPISILPAISKVFEKLIFNRLSSFFNQFGIINNNQYGFQKGLSTELATTKFCEDVLKGLNNNDPSCAILLDLSKAFDSVNRKILLFKLYKYGIRGSAYNLLQSYLSNRKQFIKVGNIKSNYCDVEVGLPQGSIISPLLFLILINDLKNCTNLQVINFADDTLIYHKINDPTNINLYINMEFDKVKQWMSANHLRINYSKTKHIIFSTNSSKLSLFNKISIKGDNNNVIERVEDCKYLGIFLDEKLTWKKHIEHIMKKLSKTIGVFYRIRRLLNKSSLVLILKSLFITHLKYGILCYGRANKTNLKPLNILFNRALRCINFYKQKEIRVSQLYTDQQVLTLDNMFTLEIAKFSYKFKNNKLPSSFDHIFTETSAIHNHNTRTSNNFFQNRQLRQFGFNSVTHIGTKIWNKIPTQIQSQKNYSLFCSKFKKHLLQNHLYEG